MADYYSILRKTIDRLPSNDESHRMAVYGKARTAIETQLRKMDPPPGENAILAQLDLLENAITKIESEHALPEAQEHADPEIPEPVLSDSAGKEQPVQASEPAQPAVEESRVEHSIPPAAGPADTVPEPAEPEQPGMQPTVEQPPVAQQPAPNQPVDEPQLNPNKATEIQDTSVSPVMPPPAASEAGAGEPPKVDSIVSPATAQSPAGGTTRRSGFARVAIIAIIALLILGGGGYALWLNKDDLGTAIGNLLGEPDKAPVENAVSEQSDQSQEGGIKELIDQDEENQESASVSEEQKAEKEPVRLGEQGQDEPADPVDEESTETETEVPIVLNPETGDQADTGVSEQADNEVKEVEPVEEETPESVPAPLPLGEVAYLYEEGAAGAGATRTNAAIAWSIKRESPEEGVAPEAVIYGQMEAPEKGLSLTISIKRNVDQALSASHMIELLFSVPQNFAGGEIENIARFVMKPSEEARGEPLVAVPIKVSEGYFLIALDNLEQAVNVNTKLLLESKWIDVPVSYSIGKRALVTLEKGGSGEQVFREAFEEWKNL